jgi:hypothetical protein
MRTWLTTASLPNPERGLVEVACWAHTRRHFHQALDTDPARMGAVLAYIAQLYAVEKRARRCGVQGEALRLLREHWSQPVLEQLHEYLPKEIRDQVLPKSEARQAVSYALKNWIALTRYCTIWRSTITTRSGRCAGSQWGGTTGCFWAAIAAARPWRCCEALWCRANW